MNFETMTIAEQRWYRAWRAQIGYALHAGADEDFDRYCKNAAIAQAEYLMAQVLKL